jgi:hypothetical protein
VETNGIESSAWATAIARVAAKRMRRNFVFIIWRLAMHAAGQPKSRDRLEEVV